MSWTTISGSEASMRCWLQLPQNPRTLVLVLPEVFGINGWLRSFAARLAEAGHGALVMPIFSRTAPELDLGYDDAALAEGRHHRDAVTVAGFQRDLEGLWAGSRLSLSWLICRWLGWDFVLAVIWPGIWPAGLTCGPPSASTARGWPAPVQAVARPRWR
jgi:hypothetical protein